MQSARVTRIRHLTYTLMRAPGCGGIPLSSSGQENEVWGPHAEKLPHQVDRHGWTVANVYMLSGSRCVGFPGSICILRVTSFQVSGQGSIS